MPLCFFKEKTLEVNYDFQLFLICQYSPLQLSYNTFNTSYSDDLQSQSDKKINNNQNKQKANIKTDRLAQGVFVTSRYSIYGQKGE